MIVVLERWRRTLNLSTVILDFHRVNQIKSEGQSAASDAAGRKVTVMAPLSPSSLSVRLV